MKKNEEFYTLAIDYAGCSPDVLMGCRTLEAAYSEQRRCLVDFYRDYCKPDFETFKEFYEHVETYECLATGFRHYVFYDDDFITVDKRPFVS